MLGLEVGNDDVSIEPAAKLLLDPGGVCACDFKGIFVGFGVMEECLPDERGKAL